MKAKAEIIYKLLSEVVQINSSFKAKHNIYKCFQLRFNTLGTIILFIEHLQNLPYL